MKRALITLTLAAILGAWIGATSNNQDCTTDTECMRLCPTDDSVCDGGPELEVKPMSQQGGVRA
jgi:hypothetical protein